ncbi:hypothetical protein GW931_00085 [archaeon]|nr:hypothetical protein [archaeon]
MNKKFNFILIIIILLSFSMIILEQEKIHGFAIEQEVTSNVSISKTLAISFSTELSNGINFGEVNFLPATNVDADKNFNDTNETLYYVEVSPDGNVPIDICVKGDSNLINVGGDFIPLNYETYSSSLSNNLTLPDVANEVSFTPIYFVSGNDVPLGEKLFYRFYLDVPAGQASGQYNNTVSFKGIAFDLTC